MDAVYSLLYFCAVFVELTEKPDERKPTSFLFVIKERTEFLLLFGGEMPSFRNGKGKVFSAEKMYFMSMSGGNAH